MQSSKRLALALNRFDRAVLLILLSLALVIALLIWRGDRVGVQVESLSPAADAPAVSTAAIFRVTFDQAMVEPQEESQPVFVVAPPVAGEVRWQGNSVAFVPAEPLQPDTTYTISLAAGLEGERGRQLLRPVSWQFHTGRPRVAYIAWDEADTGQIFVADVETGQTTTLTTEAADVLDFAVGRGGSESPDGITIAYSVLREDGGADLWAVDGDGSGRRLLLACPEAACTQPVWQPDGRRLIFEKRLIPQPGAAPGAPRLWWLDPAGGATAPIFQDSQELGLGARFSPDGRWLAFVAALGRGIRVTNLENGANRLIPSQVGSPPSWSPDSAALLITDIQLQEETWAVHVLRTEPESETVTDLTGDFAVDDNSPAWSPDGAWIAVARKGARDTAGRQIWLLRPDGSETVALTQSPELHHTAPAWSPDGRFLLFQQTSLEQPGADPTIWLIEVATGELKQIAPAGVQPAWIP